MTISINFVRVVLVLFGHCKRVPSTNLIILFEGKTKLILLIDLEKLIFMTFNSSI